MLVKEFRTPIMVTLLYIGLSIAFHVWSLHVRWYEPMSFWWTDGLLALFVLQRFSNYIFPIFSSCKLKSKISASAFYYYYYKRTALTITNPRFYEDLSWLQNWSHCSANQYLFSTIFLFGDTLNTSVGICVDLLCLILGDSKFFIGVILGCFPFIFTLKRR